MEMRRYVRHSPAWWIVGGILALLTAGCIVLGLLAQRDSAAAEAVPIGDEIYLGDYNYIDVQYMTTWAYRVTPGASWSSIWRRTRRDTAIWCS